MKPFAGKWRIVEMEVWDQEYIDMDVPGFIRIGLDGTGQFQFGLPPPGDIDGRVEQCGNALRFEFSWSGQEENDPVCGRGWAIENGELNGRIYLHLADDSAFRCIKSKL